MRQRLIGRQPVSLSNQPLMHCCAYLLGVWLAWACCHWRLMYLPVWTNCMQTMLAGLVTPCTQMCPAAIAWCLAHKEGCFCFVWSFCMVTLFTGSHAHTWGRSSFAFSSRGSSLLQLKYHSTPDIACLVLLGGWSGGKVLATEEAVATEPAADSHGNQAFATLD